MDLRHLAAARRKDWYDIAFLLVTTKTAAYGGSGAGPGGIRDPTGTICTQLQDLQANYADSSTQGTSAFMNQITLDHPESIRAPQPRTRSCWWGRSPTSCSAFDAVDGRWPSSAVENLGRGVERLESGVESPSIDRHLERRSGMDSVSTPAT